MPVGGVFVTVGGCGWVVAGLSAGMDVDAATGVSVVAPVVIVGTVVCTAVLLTSAVGGGPLAPAAVPLVALVAVIVGVTDVLTVSEQMQ